jgi:hypothetical protein
MLKCSNANAHERRFIIRLLVLLMRLQTVLLHWINTKIYQYLYQILYLKGRLCMYHVIYLSHVLEPVYLCICHT